MSLISTFEKSWRYTSWSYVDFEYGFTSLKQKILAPMYGSPYNKLATVFDNAIVYPPNVKLSKNSSVCDKSVRCKL